MTSERLYSTRELAQLWNVSETTIKRWSSNKGLKCIKTPGGHRRFSLNEIIKFQGKIGFEASGLLHGADSGFSDLEIWINSKNFEEIRRFILLLAVHNRTADITEFLNRLYIRGISIADFYDEILVILEGISHQRRGDIQLKGYQLNLVRSNLTAAFHFFFLQLEPGKKNGRTALCVSTVANAVIPLQLMSCIFKEEGWECLTLRDPCDLRMIRECVKKEPVNLLAVWLPEGYTAEPETEQRDKLVSFLSKYRIPVIVIQNNPYSRVLAEYYSERSVRSFREFQRFVRTLL